MNDQSHIESVLKKRFPLVQVLQSRESMGEEHLLLRRRHLQPALNFLRSDPDTQVDMLVDISAIQHLEVNTSFVFSRLIAPPFYEAFYLLRSTRLDYRLRISVLISDEQPSLPTVSSIFSGAAWLENEIWDLFGIYIEGHPHLRRLLLYPAFAGHPLRKNYPIAKDQPLVAIKGRK